MESETTKIIENSYRATILAFLDECDYTLEAARQRRFAEIFAGIGTDPGEVLAVTFEADHDDYSSIMVKALADLTAAQVLKAQPQELTQKLAQMLDNVKALENISVDFPRGLSGRSSGVFGR